MNSKQRLTSHLELNLSIRQKVLIGAIAGLALLAVLFISLDDGPVSVASAEAEANAYMFVETIEVGDAETYKAASAWVVLKDCSGEVLSRVNNPASKLNSGTRSSSRVFVDLPKGKKSAYQLEVTFMHEDGSHKKITQTIIPQEMSSGTIVIKDTDENKVQPCED